MSVCLSVSLSDSTPYYVEFYQKYMCITLLVDRPLLSEILVDKCDEMPSKLFGKVSIFCINYFQSSMIDV